MDNHDPFAELEYKMPPPGTRPSANASMVNLNGVVPATAGAKQAIPSKHIQLKAENYDLWFQNERLAEENAHIANEHGKLHDKHEKVKHLIF